MKTFLISFLFSIFSCHTTPPKTAASASPEASTSAHASSTSSVSGRVYKGAPTGEKSYSGCEGCGEPGEFTFHADGKVTFIYPGSDIIESGTWSQKGSTVTVRNESRGVEVTFSVEDGGKSILDARYATRYFLQ